MTLTKTLIKRDFNQRAEYYHNNSKLQKNIAEDLYLLAKEYIKPNSKILDLGAGSGAIAHYIPNKLHHNITLLDNAKPMLDIAKKQFPNCKTLLADFNDLNEHKQKYDIIFANMSLHWSLNIHETLKQITNLLTINGIIFISLPSNASFKEIKEINLHLSTKLQINPLISPLDFAQNTILTKFYQQDFNSLLELLHHFTLSGTGYKAKHSKALTKADYRYLTTIDNKIKQLSWEIIFVRVGSSPTG